VNSIFNLNEKVIIVTGGSGLIGKGFVKTIAKNGGIVIIADIINNFKKPIDSENSNNEKPIDGRVKFIKVDINSKDTIIKMINKILKNYGKIDGLVNNAYPKNKNYGRKFEGVTYEDFCENINLHVGGYFLITQQISKIMMKQNYGNIINIGSTYGFAAPRFEIYEGTEMTTPVEYAAIKGAIINLTKYLASYLGKYNIRVNCISPGGVYDHQPETFVKKYSQKVLLEKRMANVDDLTGALLFLLSDNSKYITGQNIVVDGGWSL
jgi:NAD(P)-dependent dehydrogenase (short-subunit alcohol dehydrogenase family)